jgi:hypothetical protein
MGDRNSGKTRNWTKIYAVYFCKIKAEFVKNRVVLVILFFLLHTNYKMVWHRSFARLAERADVAPALKKVKL